ncbi:hypothetical protein HG531_007689 [Fusarium graminearum]|nr:hypothetical protein HG531_007689 [Fusarium graminearum]
MLLTLTFSPNGLEDANHTVVAQALENHLHAVTALAHLILSFGRGDTLDAALNTLLAPATDDAILEPAVFLSLAQLTPNLISDPRSELNHSRHSGLVGILGCALVGDIKLLLLDHRENTREVEVSHLRLHPTLLDIDNARLHNLVYSTGHSTLFQVDASGVKSASLWVDIVLDGVGAENMGGEGIKLRRRVS